MSLLLPSQTPADDDADLEETLKTCSTKPKSGIKAAKVATQPKKEESSSDNSGSDNSGYSGSSSSDEEYKPKADKSAPVNVKPSTKPKSEENKTSEAAKEGGYHIGGLINLSNVQSQSWCPKPNPEQTPSMRSGPNGNIDWLVCSP